MSKLSRKEVTSKLTEACIGYWVHKTYSVYKEVGLNRWGKSRADIIALNHKSEIVIVEVKSCHADFSSDTKYLNYLPFCNKMYFCITNDYYESKQSEELLLSAKDNGIGVLILDRSTGYITAKRNASRRSLDDSNVLGIIIRLAWRGGLSKRTKPRRSRIFL